MVCIVGIFAAGQTSSKADEISYNRDVRPLLADRCFKCHGPDGAAREGELRLDRREDALAAIAPHFPAKSALVERIESPAAEARMPPPNSGKELSAGEIAMLKRWIAEGAKYEPHWSFVPPTRPKLPVIPNAAAANLRSPIDAFVASRLRDFRRTLAPEADKATLLRRVTLDLTGLPPTPEESAAFLADNSPDAYAHVVDQLLASPRYGEHMAVSWLDLARYADTHGYGVDSYRTMWQWRDWVIRALNANRPFDEFTVDQLAGDLLPSATQQQRIATAFNRNHPIQLETGAVDEEFRVETVVDRTSTTATVWLGLTLGCARCHDHKYDPISQRDFYQLYAYFNSVDELGVPSKYGDVNSHRGNHGPLLATPEYGLLPEQNAATPVTPTLMVMRDLAQPRETRLLKRGAYDEPFGEPLAPNIPPALGELPAENTADRAALAQWLVSGGNPLTARVTVNRYWQHFFGAGIVATSDDFGLQGSPPTHPELLDWLAVEFVKSGWNVKALHRQIVMSATYRQSSQMSAWHREHDPHNRWLARGPSVRLSAEAIRDAALFASGTLVEQLGGPPVRPFQPEGLWAEANYLSERTYVADVGAGLYRRSVYTYWRRTLPPPVMEAFDAPSRDVCVARRATTTTPLQSLVLLNDPTRLEASRQLAERVSQERSVTAQISAGFQRVLARAPRAEELAILEKAHQAAHADFTKNHSAAKTLLSIGTSPASASDDPVALAALTLVIRIIFNLDEAITKR